MNTQAASLKKVLATGTALAALIFASPVFATDKPRQESSVETAETLTQHQAFTRKQLIATVKLYDEHLRVPSTGQYLDRIDTHAREQYSVVSSIASTGVGLMSLAIGDEVGAIDNAAEKAIVTLKALLNRDSSKAFLTPRSKSGWYAHFINAYTGDVRLPSQGKVSTIDTAILGVGASMVAEYFEDKAATDENAAEAARLANELVHGVDWGQSVRFDRVPGMHQIFRGEEEVIEQRFWSHIFDEYVILPCVGRAVEAEQGRSGRATQFWNTYLSDIANLPQAKVGDLSVLAVNGRRFTSHFTHQFAFYFCGELAADPAYRAELDELKQADKKWFRETNDKSIPERWWGLGAGSEIKFDKETGEISYSGYGVARIGKNPNNTFSPAIMAGFIPVENTGRDRSDLLQRVASTPKIRKGYSDIVADLIELHENDECRYNYQGLDFLWRCTARDPSLRVQHIEGVDLSTYMLGLAWFDPKLGEQFFDKYSVKVRASFPEARELRAEAPTVSIARRK